MKPRGWTFLLLARVVCLCGMVALVLIGPHAVAQTGWKQTEYILGTFWDPPLNTREKPLSIDSSSFALAKAAYFNLLTGVQGETGIDRTFEGMKWALAVANRVGLKYLVGDNRVYEAYDNKFDRVKATTIVSQYKSLPMDLRRTMLGYLLCDEPHFRSQALKNVSDWKWFLESADPEHLAYFNLASSYAADYNWEGFSGGNKDGTLDQSEKRNYERYLSYYVDSLKPSVVSFDHYPFFKNGTIRKDYFYNLTIIKQKAGQRPFWTFPMATDHFSYTNPTEAHLNFMYFCPLAYGAKGLIVFTFWPPSYEGFRSALVNTEGGKNEKYWIVRRLNMFVSKILGPVVMRVPNVEVLHVSDFPGSQQYITPASSSTVETMNDKRLLVGVFKSLTEFYLLVVNKDTETIFDCEIALRGRFSSVAFAPRVIGFDESTNISFNSMPTSYNSARNTSAFRIPELMGGEGRLIKVR